MKRPAWRVQPLSSFEGAKVDKMLANGADVRGAVLSRWTLRRKRRVDQVTR